MSGVVLRIGPDLSLRRAAERMTQKGVGAAIVEDEDWPVPRIITERDVLRAVGSGHDMDQEKVADHMSESVITASPEWSLERAAMEMSRRNIRHLAVYREGELIGVLSMRDILRVWTADGATSGGPP
ncbi:MAG: CBS domain-containing protein [Solirubrobacterales bacterium]|nr:CBS domain-containing protein [Solirubrobacterales bacterium]